MRNDGLFVLDLDAGGAVRAVPLSQWSPAFAEDRASGATPTSVYRSVAWVYRCVNLRADAIAGLPCELKRKGRARRKVDAGLLEARLPKLLKQVEQSLCLHAGAYLFREQNKIKLLDLKWMAFHTVTPETDADNALVGFLRQVGAKPTFLDLTDVVYVWLPDPDVEQGPGTAPAEVALAAAGIVAHSNRFAADLFERGGMNLTILVLDPATSDADVKRAELWWRRAARGNRRGWEAIGMRRNVEVKQLGYEPDKLAMPDLKASARTEIASAFGVPETMIADAANFATASAHRLSFYEDTVLPEAKLIAAALNDQLLNELGYELVWHPEQLQVFQEANALEVDGIEKLFLSGLISAEAARARAGFTEADAPKQGLGVGGQGLGTGTGTGTGTGNTPPAADGGQQDASPADSQPPATLSVRSSPLRAQPDDGADAERTDLEDRASTRLATALAAQRHAVLTGEVTPASADRIDEAAEALRVALTWTLEEGAALGVRVGGETLASLGIEFSASGVNEAALAWARDYAGQLVTGINDTTRSALREKIAQWIESGDALDALVDELEPTFGAGRARLIASTEVTRSFAQGNLRAWQTVEAVTGKTWRTAADERVCPVCRPLAETKAKLNETFEGSYDAPPAHPGCRCWIAPTVD